MNLLDWLGITNAGKPLEVGDAAPNAVSRDERGEEVRLADLYGEGFTLVYFYPKADTPGCTAQACSLRDDFTQLQERGVRVVGVSADGPESQRRFKEKHRLPFVLLADPERAVAKAFGVPLMLGMTHRQSFLIKGGRVVWRDLGASTREQARDVLNALEKLG
ncbi:MAG TPA: peroxiredoxin [Candidatus Methylacidiphilales bacterium]|jgi:peroxiredoxin Q/BCP|nr:peroxiredoxin [Candidatus Methylacidiphilales bacterium]